MKTYKDQANETKQALRDLGNTICKELGIFCLLDWMVKVLTKKKKV
jgi:hypothetical protein